MRQRSPKPSLAGRGRLFGSGPVRLKGDGSRNGRRASQRASGACVDYEVRAPHELVRQAMRTSRVDDGGQSSLDGRRHEARDALRSHAASSSCPSHRVPPPTTVLSTRRVIASELRPCPSRFDASPSRRIKGIGLGRAWRRRAEARRSSAAHPAAARRPAHLSALDHHLGLQQLDPLFGRSAMAALTSDATAHLGAASSPAPAPL
jgi:hypothetical protein